MSRRPALGSVSEKNLVQAWHHRNDPLAGVGLDAAIEDIVLRIGGLAAGHPEVAELDCNPVVAGPAGAVVVGARLRLEPPPPAAPYAAVGRS